MAQTATNVVYSSPKASGCVYRAPEGTTAPSDATAALADAFKCVGYINSDGVNENHSLSSETVEDYGMTPVLVIDGSDEVTVDFTPIEYGNPVMHEAIYNSSNVKSTGGKLTSVTINDSAKEVCVYVFEHVLSNGRIERDVYPRAKVTGIDALNYSKSSALGPKLTLTALVDNSGNKGYKYFADASASAADAQSEADETKAAN